MSQNNTALVLVPVAKNSFTQDEKHLSKSEKFVPVKPEWGAEILNEYGYFLKSLNVGKARKTENAAHQTTIATYQKETQLAVGDIFPRITLKIPHIYGAIQTLAAFLRLSCLNGNAVRLDETKAPRIKHLGDAMSQFENTVRGLVSYTDEMNDSIREMMARDVTPSQVADFVREAVNLRLGHNPNVQDVDYSTLLTVRRASDSGRDAFTQYQVVQEALMRFGFKYGLKSQDENGVVSIRNMTARPVTRSNTGEIETIRSVDLNADLHQAALKILMNK